MDEPTTLELWSTGYLVLGFIVLLSTAFIRKVDGMKPLNHLRWVTVSAVLLIASCSLNSSPGRTAVVAVIAFAIGWAWSREFASRPKERDHYNA